MKKKIILIYSYTPSKLEELLRFAENMQNDFNFLVIVSDERYLNIVSKYSFEYICLHCKGNSKSFKLSFSRELMRNSISSKILNYIKQYSIGQIIWKSLFYNDYQFYYKKCKNIFTDYNVKLLITIHDNTMFSINNALVKLAKDSNITILLPYIMYVNPESTFLTKNGNERYTMTNKSSLFEKIVFKKHIDKTYKNYYSLPAFGLAALEQFGTLSEMPWLDGGGNSDIVAVSNKIGYNLHKIMGIDEKKLKLIGDVSLDKLFYNFNKKVDINNFIYKKYNLDRSKKLMLVGLSHWWEHNMADKATHFDIVNHTLESTLIFKKDYNILVVLHPSMEKRNYTFLESKYKIQIINDSTSDILPAVDLYVTNYSSTVIWSILCNIKTLVVGYHKNFTIYDHFKSIEIVKNKNELLKSLERLINKEVDFSSDHLLLSKKELFNGNIINNYKNLIIELIEKR